MSSITEQKLHDQYYEGSPIRFKRRFEDFPDDLVVRDVDGVRSRCYVNWGTVVVEYYEPFEYYSSQITNENQTLFGCWKYDEEKNIAVQYKPTTLVQRGKDFLWISTKNFQNMQRSQVVNWGVAVGSKPYAFFELNGGTMVGMRGNEVFITPNPLNLTSFSDWAANL